MTFATLALRPAGLSDAAFIRAVYFETQRWIIEALFGWRGDEAELVKFEDSHDPGNTSIVVVDGEDVGWVTIRRGPGIELDSIYVKASMQRHGVGTAIIQNLIVEAQSTGKLLGLSTAKINPARRLYERLGFVAVGESELKVFMLWRPAT